MSEPVMHSPIPWAASEQAEHSGVVWLSAADGLQVAMVLNHPECVANAALIVKAANLHNELVAALTDAEQMLLVAMREDLVFGERVQNKIIAEHPGMKAIREALAQAKG